MKTFPRKLLAATMLASFCLCASAQARSRGMAGVGCEGCHGSHDNSSVLLSPLLVTPGFETTLQLVISDPEARVAGVFIEVEDTTSLTIPNGEQMAVVFGGAAHTSPRAFSGGQATYELRWDVPNEPGVTRFVVSSLAADGDGRNDESDEGYVEAFDVVYGCEPQTYFGDVDGDGHGRSSLTRTFCADTVVDGFAAIGDDCDDQDEGVHPGADEHCNRKDDNCDGDIDEDALPVELYPDVDGDGFYSVEERQSSEGVLGCLPYDGYADRPGDCAPDNPDAHPDAEEVCEGRVDEDCDGDIDDRVRPICGLGWCRRESYSCNIADCIPGAPSEEVCNFVDDDCDDEIDEGDLCPAGEQCLAGECRPTETPAMSGAGRQTGLTGGSTGDEGSLTDVERPAPESPAGGCVWTGPGKRSRNELLLLVLGAFFIRCRWRRCVRWR